MTEENSFTASANFKESFDNMPLPNLNNKTELLKSGANTVKVNIKPREHAKTHMYKTINSGQIKTSKNKN